jgi:hypothetical protein
MSERVQNLLYLLHALPTPKLYYILETYSTDPKAGTRTSVSVYYFSDFPWLRCLVPN